MHDRASKKAAGEDMTPISGEPAGRLVRTRFADLIPSSLRWIAWLSRARQRARLCLEWRGVRAHPYLLTLIAPAAWLTVPYSNE
jgi:hypothetical protein